MANFTPVQAPVQLLTTKGRRRYYANPYCLAAPPLAMGPALIYNRRRPFMVRSWTGACSGVKLAIGQEVDMSIATGASRATLGPLYAVIQRAHAPHPNACSEHGFGACV